MFEGFTSTIINAPIEKVWNQIKDFNGLPDWHPMVESSRIEDGLANGVNGCVRELTLTGSGELVREQLLGYSSEEYSIVYNILESGMPVTDYISIMRLRPVVDGNITFFEWSVKFEIVPGNDGKKQTDFFKFEVFQFGFNELKKIFKG
jgi:hypothetical protein